MFAFFLDLLDGRLDFWGYFLMDVGQKIWDFLCWGREWLLNHDRPIFGCIHAAKGKLYYNKKLSEEDLLRNKCFLIQEYFWGLDSREEEYLFLMIFMEWPSRFRTILISSIFDVMNCLQIIKPDYILLPAFWPHHLSSTLSSNLELLSWFYDFI